MKAWSVSVGGDPDEQLETQERWQEFCESFTSTDILVIRRYVNNRIKVTCQILLDPSQPIDSTGSMPSFIEQAQNAGFVDIDVQELALCDACNTAKGDR
jgi:hypothetical protein